MKLSYKILISFTFLLIAVFITTSCGIDKRQNEDTSGKLRVISSFSIITDMVKEIGGDSVMVHNLIPVGSDPHEYSPKPEDVKFAATADVYIYNGINLEGGEKGWFMKLLHSVDADMTKVFAVTDDVKPKYLNGTQDSRKINPHAFIDPNVGMKMVLAIEKALVAVDSANSDYYRANAERYLDELRVVEEEYRTKMNEIPEEDRVFMASELAFQYMTDRYGLKEGCIWAIDTDENGSPDQIKRAIEFVKENKPPVLFVESNVDRRPMETISESTGVPIYRFPIFSDELGKPGQEADSYIKYLRYNLKHIHDGLMGLD